MPEGFVQVAPDSTGKRLRTRERTVGSTTVQEQYVIASQSEAVPVNRLWLSTFRIPQRALTAGNAQPLFSIWNGIGAGGNNLSIRRMTCEVDTLAAQTTASGQLRVYRTTAAATGGSTITPVQQYTVDAALNAAVVVRADHQADNAVATTALAQTGLATVPMWSQTVPRFHTLVGYQALGEYNLMPNDGSLMAVDPLILRPSEGVHVQVHGSGALAASAYTYTLKAVIAEFTYP